MYAVPCLRKAYSDPQATCMIGHVDGAGNDGNPNTSFQRASSGVECRGPIQAYEAHSSPPRQLRPSILLPMMMMEVTAISHHSVAKDCPRKVLLLKTGPMREIIVSEQAPSVASTKSSRTGGRGAETASPAPVLDRDFPSRRQENADEEKLLNLRPPACSKKFILCTSCEPRRRLRVMIGSG